MVKLNFARGFCPSFPPSLDGVIDRDEYLNKILPRLRAVETEVGALLNPQGTVTCGFWIIVSLLWLSLVGVPIALILIFTQAAKTQTRMLEADGHLSSFLEEATASLSKQYEPSGVKFFHVNQNGLHSVEIRFTPRNGIAVVQPQVMPTAYMPAAAAGYQVPGAPAFYPPGVVVPQQATLPPPQYSDVTSPYPPPQIQYTTAQGVSPVMPSAPPAQNATVGVPPAIVRY